MPNYSLNTTGAQFKPFSFQEIIAPYEMMRTAEEKLQNDYIQMSDQVGEWQAAVESSPTLSARLQNYQDKVRAASDRLAATGKLDRGAFFELRNQMTAQIAPIKKAVTEYNKAIELDTKMRAADGTYIAKRQVPTLEDFANGDNRYSGGISGNTVLTRAAAAGKELSKEQRAVIDGFVSDGAFVKMSQETGIPVEQLTLQAIRSGNAPKEVLDVYNSLRDSIGYNDYDQTGKDMIDSNIQLGLLSASRERKEAFQRNPHDEWVSSYQKQRDALEEAWRERKFGADLASSGIVETIVGTNPDGTPKYGYSLDYNALAQRSMANQAGKAQNNGVTIQVPQGYDSISSDSSIIDEIDNLIGKEGIAHSGNVWQNKKGTEIIVRLNNGSYRYFDVKDGKITKSAKNDTKDIKMETRKINMNPARIGYSNNIVGIGANYQGQTVQTPNISPEITAEAQNIIESIPGDLDDLRAATVAVDEEVNKNTNTNSIEQDSNIQKLERRVIYTENELKKIDKIISALEPPARLYALRQSHSMSVRYQPTTKEEEEAYKLLQQIKEKKVIYEEVLKRKKRELHQYKQVSLQNKRKSDYTNSNIKAIKEASEYLNQ